jgi:hypothetical protein
MSRRHLILFSAGVACAVVIAAMLVGLSASKCRAETLQCASAIASICLSAHVWAEDHGGFMPTNFICMSNEISAPKILSCIPSRRTRTEEWSEYTAQNCTYEILVPGMRADDTNTAFLRCTIHGHLGYSDSTVFDGVRRRHKFD